ncbi:BACON domain-containing protein [Zunongwangia sp. HGR-M22]|uniref:BACON domain-containing protein n=1 Tax=Zunongwangia sp. HGR-M22 TaxID=3015168 RepID=UPI0022DDC391|nr:hypothetical protein [Zunongwangia sp. HGR-M22]WBL25129.1 hypothetical protein PBT91_14645 [Zunongwangia sp. HGR-M22]
MADNPHEGYELGLNPRSLSITYKKFSGVIPNEIVALLWRYTVEDNIEILDAPQWLFIILEEIWRLDSGKIGRSDYKIAINENIANNLAPGNYSADIKIRGTVSSNLLLGGRSLTYTLQVNLTVLEGSLLDISSRSFTFNYRRGQNPPAKQFLNIKTGNNWSIVTDQTWLSFSQDNGQGNATITLNADPAGINKTSNRANFIVDDGRSKIQGIVWLYVFGSNEEADYLNVTKSLITFSENYQKPPSRSTTFQIDASMNAEITTDANWLQLSPSNVMSGVNQISVKSINTELLEIGSYTSKIEIAGDGFGSVFIDVLLDIVQETTEGLESNKLYFADDRNKLKLGNAGKNAEAILNFTTVGTVQTLRYTKRAPYFQNIANILIGQETDTLLSPQILPPLDTQSFSPVIPIRYDFEVLDKTMGNQLSKLRETFSNIQFLNGKTPTLGKLSYIPENITVPKDGIIAFSILTDEAIDQAIITGDIQTQIPISKTGKVLTFIFNLNEYGLNSKNTFQISFGTINLQVVVKPSDAPSTQLIWLNEWDCPEIFNCDGIFKIIDEEESTVSVRNRDGKEYSTIVDIQEPKSFEINTGNIYSEKEVAFLASVLRSKKIWLEHQGQRWEVLRDFRSLITSETRRYNRNFDLKFNFASK